MSNFKEIIDYLKVFRRSEEAAAKETHLTAMVIDKDFISGQPPHEDDYIFVKKEDIYQQNSYVSVSEQMESETLYLQEQPDGELYYYTQKEVLINNTPTNLFKRIPFYTTDEVWIPLDENTLIAKATEAIGNFYYDQANGKIIEVSLESVYVFPDYFIYHPEALKADNGQYEFDYKDHEGNTASAYDRFFKLSKQLKTDRLHRKVIFQKSIQPCFVSLLPRIKASHSGKYYLQYVRYEKGIPFNGFLGESVMTLEFNYFGSLLKFLNATVFYGLDSTDAFNSKNREAFFCDYIDLVDDLIYKAKNNEALEILYYIPSFFYGNLDLDFLWNLLDNTLDGSVTNFGLDTEDIVIDILEGLAESYEDKDIFLSELIKRQSKSKTSILHQLIYRVDGENFKKMTSLLWKIWKESGFSEVDPKTNKIITENSPVFLDYRSDKTIGFHHDNATINWNAKTNTIDVKVTKGTGVFETNTVDNGRGGSTTETTEIKETFEYSYHPFSPIVIFSADNPHFILKENNENGEPYQFMPAFVLYANDESAFWENWITAGEYTVDVLTTLSGVGNILKFGRLYKVLQAGKKLTDSSRVFTKVITGVKGVAGVAEISSGSMNILLKLTGVADTELGREISKYLFWFEMAALSGELSVALYGKMQASAKKILAKEEVLIESVTNADEAKQVDELLDELRRMADGGNNPKFSVISDKVKDYWIKYLTKKGVKIEIGTEEANRILDENFADGLFVRKGYNGETNQFKEQIIYLKNEPSTSAFLEETYHALQNIEGVQMYKDVTYKGVIYEKVDNWEFLAKKRILDEAEKNGISYEEYILVEKQLDDVLNNRYNK